ncbi:MAG: beta galactosidase jelly roll domain-containing protein [Bryobacterales bacterium]|nr:beta galactosidase jelly roll domain-containing protein [Bryobacterales bacterium]
MSDKSSRRQWLRSGGLSAAGFLGAQQAESQPARDALQDTIPHDTQRITLCGEWLFRLDADNQGQAQAFSETNQPSPGWRSVTVPHTWQVEPENTEHYAPAWYTRTFDVPAYWRNSCVRLEFEAVFHSAWVWVNGNEIGSHVGKGYTAFTFDISSFIRYGQTNRITVRVDNAFNDAMLPRGRSSDWAHDGGLYRPVALLVTPKAYVEHVAIDAVPDLAAGSANLNVAVTLCNTDSQSVTASLLCRVVEERTGQAVLEWTQPNPVALPAMEAVTLKIPPVTLSGAKLWHIDHPFLYRLEMELRTASHAPHRFAETFGVRSFEIRDGAFYLNGERIRPMGVERMAGSNPCYGMAEPEAWLHHDHQDMVELNGIFTRVHWPQDRRTLDFCDRHGILIQTEVPTWGPKTFAGMTGEPTPEILNNGLEQLREMIARDRNHPSIYAWGMCNEIGGQHPAAYRFAERLYQEAATLDPRRLRTYASHSLKETPGNDVSRLMDFVSWNEYYESWTPGTPDDLRRNLQEIIAAFPGKPIVVSEYGYCACTADRPEGDARRIQVLHEHNSVFRDFPEVAGLIFFCYNDYRTQVGDRGLGALKQRVHGVVDVIGGRKPSFAALRAESSPVEQLTLKGTPARLRATIRTRATLPAWKLDGYRLQWTAYGYGDFPAEQSTVDIPSLSPGAVFETSFKCETREPVRIVVEVLRPTGDSTYTAEWRP